MKYASQIFFDGIREAKATKSAEFCLTILRYIIKLEKNEFFSKITKHFIKSLVNI